MEIQNTCRTDNRWNLHIVFEWRSRKGRRDVERPKTDGLTT